MKPKKPLPTEQPFLTFVSCTWCRPQGLAAMMKSVYRQTLAAEIEHIVIPDYIGVSPNDSVYGRLPKYVDAAHGEYVHVLGDDDVLADDRVVERVKLFARRNGNPEAIVVRVKKGDQEYPKCGLNGTPVEGDVDLCSYVMRQDIWKAHMTQYGQHYKCDWDGYLELKAHANGGMVPCDVLFAIGRVGGGRPEAVDW